jgi:hypothetical protein
MATNKMNQIVNNTNLEIYKAKARTIFAEAKNALVNDEITMSDLLKLDLEFDKAVMGVVECEKKKAKLNNEEVKNKRLLDIARDIVYGEDDECDEECENEEDDTDDNSHVNEVFGMVFGAFGF